MASQRQLDANRRNARLSEGPNTPQGRAAVRFNALRHGLTAQDAVISDEDRTQFNRHLAAYRDEFEPATPLEHGLLDQLVQAAWRLRRLRGMETALFDLRMEERQEAMRRDHGSLQPHGRHAYVFLFDVRGANSFLTLSRYEARAERSFYKALHELQDLQSRRSGGDPPPPDNGEAPVAARHNSQLPPQEPALAAVPEDRPNLGLGLFGKIPAGRFPAPALPIVFHPPHLFLLPSPSRCRAR